MNAVVVVASAHIVLGLAVFVAVVRQHWQGRLAKPRRLYLGVALWLVLYGVVLYAGLHDRGGIGGSTGGG